MNRYAVRLLWAVGAVIVLAGCALWLLGCQPPKDAAATAAADFQLGAACKEDEDVAKRNATSCADLEKRLNQSASCRELHPDGFHLGCKGVPQ